MEKSKTNKNYYQRHKKRLRFKLLLRGRERDKNPINRLMDHARRRAKQLNILININKDDIVIPKQCPLLGIALTNIYGVGKITISNPTLDRIDNSRGYVKGNVWVISYMANAMKNNATKEELLTFAHNTLKLHS